MWELFRVRNHSVGREGPKHSRLIGCQRGAEGMASATSSSGPPTKEPKPQSARGARPHSARAASPKGSARRGRSPKPISERPKWDDTPLRSRPPALRGLSNFGTEPWARDEIVYNQRFRMWSDFSGHFDLAERSPYEHTRVLEAEQRQVSYMDRWNNKFLVCADK